ncbi:hypothetical protein V2595_09720 [Tenacibaculum maritimum]|uniref:hypothetical protein n=1 Tax=Tenacibaculum maritimum TaxID=107401 RepID=UPI003876F50B
MIVFYTENKGVTSLVSEKPDTCDRICIANCVKPKSRCCNKYQKKGINCKRCPLTFDIKVAS